MNKKLLQITTEQIDSMITIKWGKHAKSPDEISYIPYAIIGKIFGIDGSSARRIILKRFKERNNRTIMTRK